MVKWNHASDDWWCPQAENDLCVGGVFNFRMEAKDGTAGFDFSGTYTEVRREERLSYRLEDDREVTVEFADAAGGTRVTTVFDAEGENSPELQRRGWQAILDNYKAYAEGRGV